MRWDKFFDEIESQSEDERLLERDAEIADHVAAQLAESSWQDRLGIGPIDLAIRGYGRVNGTLLRRTNAWFLVQTEALELVVNPAHVTAIRNHSANPEPLSRIEQRLTWVSAMRFMQRQQPDVQVVRSDESVANGRIRTVGGNYLAVQSESGVNELTPYEAIAAVSCRRSRGRSSG